MPTKNWVDIGRCIYCPPGAQNDVLTNEHVAPEGLDRANTLLKHAACERHRKITNDIETAVLHGMFGSVREHYKRYGKRRRKRHRLPPEPLVHFRNPDGTLEAQHVPLHKHPHRLVMVDLPSPGILVGRHMDFGFPTSGELQGRTHENTFTQARRTALERQDLKGRQIWDSIDAPAFARFLAKIGYCAAFYSMGGYFDPIIVEWIVNTPANPNRGAYYVGGRFIHPGVRQFEASGDGETDHGWTTRTEPVGWTTYVITRIVFFRSWKMPTYDVVVGTTDLERINAWTAANAHVT